MAVLLLDGVKNCNDQICGLLTLQLGAQSGDLLLLLCHVLGEAVQVVLVANELDFLEAGLNKRNVVTDTLVRDEELTRLFLNNAGDDVDIFGLCVIALFLTAEAL